MQDEAFKPTPEESPKSLVEWTDQEMEDFANAFSLDDFEVVRSREAGGEDYAKVRVPNKVEQMVRGLIAAERKKVEAYDAPLERASHETMRRFIGQSANVLNASEAQEVEWIQSHADFVQAVGEMVGKPDPAYEELKMGIRREAHKMVVSSLRILLGMAVVFSAERFIQEKRDIHGGQQLPPQNVQDAILAKHAIFRKVKGLIDPDPPSDKTPRFVVVNAVDREIFRSTPELHAS